MITILIIILLIMAIGSGPYFPYSRGWGWAPSGILWVLLVIAIIMIPSASLGNVRL
jgi:hypothetical protein